jgi:hypothetical protein
MKKSIQAQELIEKAAQQGKHYWVLDGTWQYYFQISPAGEVTIMDVSHTMPEGTVKHPSIDASEEEVLYQMAREQANGN